MTAAMAAPQHVSEGRTLATVRAHCLQPTHIAHDVPGAVELRNEIGRAMGTELPGTLVFDYPTVAAITDFVASRLGGKPPAAAAAPAGTIPPVVLRYGV